MVILLYIFIVLTYVMIRQAPRNLSHTHDKGSYRIKGWLGWFRKNTTGNNSLQKNGALEIYQDSYYTVADNTIASSTGGSWAIYLDTDLNDGSGFTGKSGATGHATETRPSSVAVVYWRRFQ